MKKFLNEFFDEFGGMLGPSLMLVLFLGAMQPQDIEREQNRRPDDHVAYREDVLSDETYWTLRSCDGERVGDERYQPEATDNKALARTNPKVSPLHG